MALLLAGCGDARGGAAGVVIDTLPNGAVHVLSPEGGIWGEGEEWRLVEELRIGAMEGEGPDVFGGSVMLEVDALGRIWVADSQASELRIFEADGRHVRTVGRRGGGPGEFEQITGMDWGPEGNLWVMDGRLSRFAVFDTTGAFVETKERPAGFMTFPWTGRFDAEGRLYDLNLVTGDGVAGSRAIFRYDARVTPRDTFILPEYEQESFLITDDEGRRRVSASVPFSPGQAWYLDREGTVWLGITDRYRLHRVTFAGDTVRVLERPFRPVPVTREERDEALDRMEWFTQQGGRIDRGRVPGTKPAFRTLLGDDLGHLWVMPERPAGEPPGVDLFDPEGRYLGRLELPEGFRWPFPRPLVRDGHLYGVVTDDLDVISVVAYRIEGYPTP